MKKFIVIVSVGDDIMIEASFDMVVGEVGVTGGMDFCPCSNSFPHVSQAGG